MILNMINNPENRSQPFYLKEPFVFLLNPNLLPNDASIIKGFPLAEILPNFVNKMREEMSDLDFRLLGNTLASTVKIHRSKIEIAIRTQLRIEKSEVRRKQKEREQAFTGKQNIPIYWTRATLAANPDKYKSMFFEELMLIFEKLQTEDEGEEQAKGEGKSIRERLKGKKDDQLSDVVKEIGEKKARRKLTAGGIEQFEFALHLSITDVHLLIEDIYKIVMMESLNVGDEVEFTVIMNRHVEQQTFVNMDYRRVEQIRVLLAVLYLIQDNRIEAWEELETFKIFVKPILKPSDSQVFTT